MTPDLLSLFALEDSRAYGERVAARLGVVLVSHEERDFEDGEHATRPLQTVLGRHAVVIHSLYGAVGRSVNDKLCRLLFFCAALKDSGAARVTAVVPYLCYMRQDRRIQSDDPVTSRYLAQLFEASGIDHVVTVEVHNVAAFENAFRIPTRHIESASLFAAHFAALAGTAEIVVASPDAGGEKRAEQFRQALEAATGRRVGSAIMEKHRSRGIITGEWLAGDVAGKIAIVFDDLISTGKTLRHAATALRAAGAARIFAAAAHGLFTADAIAIIEDPIFEGVVLTDTVQPLKVSPDFAAHRLATLDSTAAVAAAIAQLH
jgi:ribose-phosphate pyrophosphokinase